MTAKLKSEHKNGWTVLRFPAIQDDGTPLWPRKLSRERLDKIRKIFGESMFSGIFQQIPMDTVEKMFDKPITDEPPSGLKMIAYWDPAFRKEASKRDFNSFSVGNSASELFYLAWGELWRSRLKESYDRVEKLCKTLGVVTLYIEGNKAEDGPEIELKSRGVNAITVMSSGSKDYRIQQYLRLVWDKVRVSRNVSQKYLRQVVEYSVLAKHDDAPDGWAGLIKCIGFGPKAKSLTKRKSFFEIYLGEDSW